MVIPPLSQGFPHTYPHHVDNLCDRNTKKMSDIGDIYQTRTVIPKILRPHFHSFIYKANYYQPVSLYLSILTLADLCTGRHIFLRCHKCQVAFCVFRTQ